MKKNGGKLYLAVVLVAIVLVAWQLINTKLIFHPAKYKTIAFFPPVTTPIMKTAFPEEALSIKTEFEKTLTARSYLVIDLESQAILLEKNTTQRLSPASTTKLMTALTALNQYDLNEVVTVSRGVALENNGGGLFPNERLTVRDLLISLLVSSANDSAFALAEHHPLGQEQFVQLMNEQAKNLHLNDTFFGNPAGFDEPINLTTARDLWLISWEAFQKPMLLEWLGLESAMVHNVEGNVRHVLFTTNGLLGRDPRILAGKTGTTELAHEVLVSLVDYQGHLLLLVVMGSDDRYADTQAILNWLAGNLSWESF
ncbi:MAG: serine hydrolase [Candidatus Paceibacterota bacterium]